MPNGVSGKTLLRTLMELCDDAIIEVCLDGKIARWNRAAERLYGYTEEEMTGQSMAHLVPIYEMPAFEAVLQDLRRGEIRKKEKMERLAKDGSCVCVAIKRSAIRDENGRVVGMIECGKAVQTGIGTGTENPLGLLIDQMPVLVWTTDKQLRITSNWGSGFHLSEIGPGKLAGKTVADFLGCEQPDAIPILRHVEALRGRGGRFEHQRDERVLDVQVEPLRSPEGNLIGCVGVALDVTDRKRTEEQMLYQATHDALTGLSNYRESVESLEREVKRATRTHGVFSVLLLDLDGLKEINDRQGHLAGNHALKRLANAMREHSRAVDVAARYGGDEFALLLIDADFTMAGQVAERICECLRAQSDGPPLSVSVGVATYPADGRTGQELLEAADQRLYRDKKDPKKKLHAVRHA